MAAVEVWPPGEFRKRAKTDGIQISKQKNFLPYVCGDPRCVRDDCQEGFGFDLYIYFAENEPPRQWKFDAKSADGPPGTFCFRLKDDPHLVHLLDIPAQTYLIYRPVNNWIEADVKRTEVFTAQQTIIYRLQGLEVSECEGLMSLMKVADESEDSFEFEVNDTGIGVDSDGWTASSEFSYHDDEVVSDMDIPADLEGQGEESNDKDFTDQDDEVIPSSQGSSEFFYR